MPRENENPVIYFDPETKKKYDNYDAYDLPDEIKERLHTIILSKKGKTIKEIEKYITISEDLHRRLLMEFESFYGDSEKMFEFYEMYPELMNMKRLETIDWSPFTNDMYHSKEYIITSKKEKEKLLKLLEERTSMPAPHHKIHIRLYYRRKLRLGKHSENLYVHEIKYTKFTTVNVRNAIAKLLDSKRENIDYYYVVAERKSIREDGMEYRTIVGRSDK